MVVTNRAAASGFSGDAKLETTGAGLEYGKSTEDLAKSYASEVGPSILRAYAELEGSGELGVMGWGQRLSALGLNSGDYGGNTLSVLAARAASPGGVYGLFHPDAWGDERPEFVFAGYSGPSLGGSLDGEPVFSVSYTRLGVEPGSVADLLACMTMGGALGGCPYFGWALMGRVASSGGVDDWVEQSIDVEADGTFGPLGTTAAGYTQGPRHDRVSVGFAGAAEGQGEASALVWLAVSNFCCIAAELRRLWTSVLREQEDEGVQREVWSLLVPGHLALVAWLAQLDTPCEDRDAFLDRLQEVIACQLDMTARDRAHPAVQRAWDLAQTASELPLWGTVWTGIPWDELGVGYDGVSESRAQGARESFLAGGQLRDLRPWAPFVVPTDDDPYSGPASDEGGLTY